MPVSPIATKPMRLKSLLIALLVAVLLAQLAAMAWVAHSQVERAAQRDAAEQSSRSALQQRPSARQPSLAQGGSDGIVKIGYAFSRQ
jgi:cytoskeletal protein RodZ